VCTEDGATGAIDTAEGSSTVTRASLLAFDACVSGCVVPRLRVQPPVEVPAVCCQDGAGLDGGGWVGFRTKRVAQGETVQP
jgi:hypothetical protein